MGLKVIFPDRFIRIYTAYESPSAILVCVSTTKIFNSVGQVYQVEFASAD
jgi:hypothetical protein